MPGQLAVAGGGTQSREFAGVVTPRLVGCEQEAQPSRLVRPCHPMDADAVPSGEALEQMGGGRYLAIRAEEAHRAYVADYAGAITVLTIAPTTASADARTSDEAPTAPNQWAFANLLGLEPALA